MHAWRWGAVLLLVAGAACSPSDDEPAAPTDGPGATTTAPPTSTGPTTTGPGATTEPTTEPSTEPTTTAPATSTSTTAPTGTTVTPAMVDVKVYLLRGERLEIAHRTVEGPAVLRGALTELLRGPTDDERAAGLGTAIPDGTSLRDVSLADGQAIVDLSGDYELGGGSLSMMARIAQVVFTATQFDNSDRVLFRLDGAPLDEFGGEGIVLTEPVERMDTARSLTGGVIVDTPDPGATVRSPFVVTGEGDFFEAQSSIRVVRDGVEVAGPFSVRAGAWGTWDEFATTVTLDLEPGPIELVLDDGGGCTPGDPECGDPLLTIVPLLLVG